MTIDYARRGDGMDGLSDAQKQRYLEVQELTQMFLEQISAHVQHSSTGADISILLEAHLAASYNAILGLAAAQSAETRAYIEDRFKTAFTLYAKNLELQPGPTEDTH